MGDDKREEIGRRGKGSRGSRVGGRKGKRQCGVQSAKCGKAKPISRRDAEARGTAKVEKQTGLQDGQDGKVKSGLACAKTVKD